MSFKRDGDDKCALNNQRKRRVTDLLYEDIHEGEVSKLSNGRYVCKVCRHGPIFDTINMFQVHRQGKKHQNSLLYQEEKAKELQDLIIKRQQEQEIKTETLHKKILNEAKREEEPVFIKKKTQPYHRKMTLELNDIKSDSATNTTPSDMLPGHRRDSQIRTAKTFVSHAQTVDIKRNINDPFKLPSQTSDSVSDRDDNISIHTSKSRVLNKDKHSYNSRREDEQVLNPNKMKQFVKQGGENSHAKFYFSRRQQTNPSKPVPNIQINLGREHTVIEKHTSMSWDRFKQMKGKHFVAPVYQRKLVNDTTTEKQVHKSTNSQWNKGQGGSIILDDRTQGCATSKPLDNGVHYTNSTQDLSSTTDKNQRAREFLNAFGAGWKRDWDGKWIRDEEAEFDSDEEAPTIT